MDSLRKDLNAFLTQNPNWLIVLDGAVDDSVLSEFLSSESLAKGAVLITSTWRWWKSDRVASVVVLPFSKSASLDFVKSQLGDVSSSLCFPLHPILETEFLFPLIRISSRIQFQMRSWRILCLHWAVSPLFSTPRAARFAHWLFPRAYTWMG